MKIEKAPERMSAKERVRRTFEFEKTDRVTIGFETNPNIYRKLCRALGLPETDIEPLYRALGVDYRPISAPYVGKELFQAPPDRRVDPLEGCVMRWVEHSTGGYWDFVDFPLQEASDEMFDRFPVPDPDDFDYAAARELARSYGGELALYAGNPGIPDILNSNGRIMGMEDVLCHLALGDEAALRFIGRRAAFQLGMMERLLETCKGLLDFVWLGEDLGTQIAPMISPELYRTRIRPIHQQFVDLAKSYGLPVIMSPSFLAAHFGGRLNFRGCISTAGPLAYGTAAETEQICRETLEIMMPVRGYHFAPTHAIQDNTPVENVIAMYNAAHRYGRY